MSLTAFLMTIKIALRIMEMFATSQMEYFLGAILIIIQIVVIHKMV